MVKSMTGYGNDTLFFEGTVITVEVKSLNSRYLDIVPKLPRSLQAIEHQLKKLLQQYFNRGRIELYVTVAGEPLQNKKVFVDWQLLDEYMHKLAEVKSKYQIDEELTLSAILNQEELFVIQEESATDESFRGILFDSVKKVCEHTVSVRKQEGVFLKEDVLERVDKIDISLSYIESHSGEIQHLYRKRIEERILQHIENSVEIDQHLLMQEIAMLAEKGDIQEEITRIHSHLDHFKAVMQQDDEMGRKLDFIVQEMHREANTIGSKSIDTKISEEVVKMKSEIEKIKEQIQNIE